MATVAIAATTREERQAVQPKRESEQAAQCYGRDDGLYLLSGLLSCELCNTVTVPVMLGGLRYYGCQNVPRCPRPLVLAEVTEQRVWNRLASRQYELAKGVKRNERRAVLAKALRRVGVGLRPSELHYEWRE